MQVFDFSKPFSYFEVFSTIAVVLFLFLVIYLFLSHKAKRFKEKSK